MTLQREKDLQSEQHEDELQKLQAKHDADISHFQQEHALSAAKVASRQTLHLVFPHCFTFYTVLSLVFHMQLLSHAQSWFETNPAVGLGCALKQPVQQRLSEMVLGV